VVIFLYLAFTCLKAGVRSERGFILKVHPEGRSPLSIGIPLSKYYYQRFFSMPGLERGNKGVRLKQVEVKIVVCTTKCKRNQRR
jgi:hypothetical protein